MGYWKLKPSEELSPYVCLEIQLEDILDFVTYWVEDRYELTNIDIKHIYNAIRDGYTEGQINDWDSMTEKLDAAN